MTNDANLDRDTSTATDRVSIAWDMEALNLAEGTLTRRIVAPTEDAAIEEMEIWLAETGCRNVEEVIEMRVEPEEQVEAPAPDL